MLTELSIGNFRAFGETQRIPIKPLTLIFGANSSGKSSIIHSLLLAHHGLETGRWDAHQTTLGGEAVDLGGFGSYVHRHDTDRMVTLGFETETNFEDLRQADGWTDQRQHLAGKEEEKAPFKFAGRFGFRMHLTPKVSIWPGEQRELKRHGRIKEGVDVLKVEVLINGRPALTLSREFELTLFRPVLDLPCNPFLLTAFAYMARFSRLFRARNELSRAPAEAQQRVRQELEALRRSFEDWERTLTAGSLEQMRTEADIVGLQEAYARTLEDRQFFFEKLVLRDNDNYDDWCWAGWRDQLMNGTYDGVLGFFMDYARDNEVAEEWWAEARAIRFNLSRFLNFYSEEIARTLRTVTYLGPLRCVPSRHVTSVRDQDPNWLASGGAAWETARKDAEVVEAVNKWLGPDRLGTNCRLLPREMVDKESLLAVLHDEPAGADPGTGAYAAVNGLLQQNAGLSAVVELLFEDVKSRTTLSHRDIGFGVSQVLPVLVSALASRGRLIAIEQPELYLHPALQAELGDVFIESALGERKNTFLLETHSEHLILRILRRIRETAASKLPAGMTRITPADVAVVFVEPAAKGSVVRELRVDERGRLTDPWPGGFFEESFNELF
jgi:hypothetical protein